MYGVSLLNRVAVVCYLSDPYMEVWKAFVFRKFVIVCCVECLRPTTVRMVSIAAFNVLFLLIYYFLLVFELVQKLLVVSLLCYPLNHCVKILLEVSVLFSFFLVVPATLVGLLIRFIHRHGLSIC